MDDVKLRIPASELRYYMQELKTELLKNIEAQISCTIETTINKLENHNKSKVDNVHKKCNRLEKDELPEKRFLLRDSVLTDLWKVTHLSSAYNICLAMMLLLYFNTVLLYIVDTQRLEDDMAIINWAAGERTVVTLLWLGMKMSTICIVYFLFKHWASFRHKKQTCGLLDYVFALAYLVYQSTFFIIPVMVLVYHNLPPISSFAILAEQVRLSMKTHAFVRENIPRAVLYKLHQDNDEKDPRPYPRFANYLYFLFAPTLVYRDVYPRTICIRWNYVAWNFLQFLTCVFTSCIAFHRFVVDIFQHVGHKPFTPVDFVLTLSGGMAVGSLAMFLVFYGFLHCWLNAFAELLCFGDRVFYQDWWNCTSFSKYYRTWNSVVHDWLYSYVYKDIYQILGRSSAMVIVFLVSAIVHEYILALTFRFLYPVLFILFSSFGVLVVFLTRRRTSSGWNVFLWMSLFIGWGFLITLYSMEWYARANNCPSYVHPYLDYIVPRSWSCTVFKMHSYQQIIGN
ncbi:sterol O-acyltransferase 1-like [Tachypleus tridentatus]|uniref:sterol O-acyltransferase 1-like n=1 Tax=Tachypleus tridentatus TaxID=6853 RepID=UPI003FD32EEF